MDEIDRAQEHEELDRSNAIREASKPLAPGVAGIAICVMSGLEG